MKVTHKQLINTFSKMGYSEYDIYPDLNITVMARHERKFDADWIDYITINGSKYYQGNTMIGGQK